MVFVIIVSATLPLSYTLKPKSLALIYLKLEVNMGVNTGVNMGIKKPKHGCKQQPWVCTCGFRLETNNISTTSLFQWLVSAKKSSQHAPSLHRRLTIL